MAKKQLVVICFQNVSLTYWYSLATVMGLDGASCDLLSKCIFDLLIFTATTTATIVTIVVICFQNVSLTYWYSLDLLEQQDLKGCDLLSKCIFDLLIFTFNFIFIKLIEVVICFQNVSLTYWYSLRVEQKHNLHRCDLLSKCIFDLLIFTIFIRFPTI